MCLRGSTIDFLCVANGKLNPKYTIKIATTTLKLHLSREHNIEDENNTAQMRRSIGLIDSNFTPSTSREAKQLLARRTVLWCAEDLIPFSVVRGIGFRRWMLSNNFVDKPEDIPHNSTLTNTALNDVYSILHKKFLKLVSQASDVILIMTDLWTSTNGNVPYITCAIRFMNDDLVLHCLTLSTEKFLRPHSSERIVEKLHELTEAVGLSDRIVIGCGDNGRNVVKMIDNMDNCVCYINCLGHSIHLVLTVDVVKCSEWDEVKTILCKVKRTHGALAYQLHNLKEHFHKAQKEEISNFLEDLENLLIEIAADEDSIPYSDADEVNQFLSSEYEAMYNDVNTFKTFSKPNATRWFSWLNLIETYLKNFDAINSLLAHTNNLDLKLGGTEYKMLCDVKKLFKTFEECLKIMQSDSEPTSIVFIIFYHEIVDKLTEYIQDANISIKSAFEVTKAAFINRVKILPEYLAAAVLDPAQFKSNYLNQYCDDQYTTPKFVLQEMIAKYKINIKCNNNGVDDTIASQANPTPAKIARIDFLNKMRGTAVHENQSTISIDDEINRYFNKARSTSIEIDVIEFWKRNMTDFPNLFKLVKILFAISPTSSKAERNFSIAGALLNKKRASMHPSTARKTIFIHDHAKLLENNEI